LNSLRGFHFAENEGIKDSEDVLAVIQHAFNGWLEPRFLIHQPLPASQNAGRNINVIPEFLQRFAPQEEAVKERRLLPGLRETGVNVHMPFTVQNKILADYSFALRKNLRKREIAKPYVKPFVKPRSLYLCGSESISVSKFEAKSPATEPDSCLQKD
jgi:hypothetical protein